MLASQVPAKFNIPWANSAGSSYVRQPPQASQIGIEDGAASLTDGFPPLCFMSLAAGGKPPKGEDFNGILRWLTQWVQWHQAGGTPTYDSAFSTAIGGYPDGAVLQSADGTHFWRSTADNNTTDPDGGSPLNWEVLQPGSYAWSDITGAPSFVLISSSTGANQSLASPGFQIMPGDPAQPRWMCVWGTVVQPGSGTNVTVTFPEAFPHACVYAGAMSGDSSAVLSLVSAPTTTQATFQNGGGTLPYFAFGY